MLPPLADSTLPAGGTQSARGALVLALRRAGVQDTGVLRAMEIVPREIFVPHHLHDLAQRNVELPIGCGQTMESPLQLASTLAALGAKDSDRVLEIGAGSGYATSVLAQLAGEVVALERFRTLAQQARARLEQLGLDNCVVQCADGLVVDESIGMFDRILMSVAVREMPPALLARLAPGGRILVPMISEQGTRMMRAEGGALSPLSLRGTFDAALNGVGEVL